MAAESRAQGPRVEPHVEPHVEPWMSGTLSELHPVWPRCCTLFNTPARTWRFGTKDLATEIFRAAWLGWRRSASISGTSAAASTGCSTYARGEQLSADQLSACGTSRERHEPRRAAESARRRI